MHGAYGIAPPPAHFNHISLCLLVVIHTITGLLRLGVKPRPPACQSDALTTTQPAPSVLKGFLGTIEVGSHSTPVSNSSRKLPSIHIIVLVHKEMYRAHTTFRLVFNFSSFPHRPMKIAVWPVFKL